MTELILFWLAIAAVAAIGAALRDIHDDDPTRSSAYHPPASHGDDAFAPHHR